MNINVTLSREEIEMLQFGLSMRRNFIETGDCNMRAADAERCGQQELIKPLLSDQMRPTIQMEDLANKLRGG